MTVSLTFTIRKIPINRLLFCNFVGERSRREEKCLLCHSYPTCKAMNPINVELHETVEDFQNHFSRDGAETMLSMSSPVNALNQLVFSPSYQLMNDAVLSPHMDVTTPIKELITKNSDKFEGGFPDDWRAKFPKEISKTFREVSVQACARFVQVKRFFVDHLKRYVDGFSDTNIRVPPIHHLVSLHFSAFKNFVSCFQCSVDRQKIEKKDYGKFSELNQKKHLCSKRIFYDVVISISAEARDAYLKFERESPHEAEAKLAHDGSNFVKLKIRSSRSNQASLSANTSIEVTQIDTSLTSTSAVDTDSASGGGDADNDNDDIDDLDEALNNDSMEI